MALELLSIATALPSCDVSQKTAAEMAKPMCCRSQAQERLLPALYRRSRVQRRASVLLTQGSDMQKGGAATQSFFAAATDAQDLGPTTGRRMQRYSREAPRLARRACAEAMDIAAVDRGEVTHLVTVSCTGFEAPGVDVSIIRQLGLPQTTARTHVGFMGCHGALNGLRVAHAFAAADDDAVVLLCAVELCSLHFHYGWVPEQVVANALFADGAAAVVAAAPAPARTGSRLRLSASGSCILPESEDAMTWRIDDHGFVMSLSPRVPKLIQSQLRPWLARWLSGFALSVDAIGSWAVHPGGPRIVSAVGEALALTDAQLAPSREVLARCGNMSSPTVLFILDDLARQDAPRPCVALGFGPGLAVEAALFE
jgi:predicted naringenin-chalcone synthase